MRIGLVGIPGAGKSALAETLKNAILHQEFSGCANCYTPVAVIDDYVQQAEEESLLAMGFMASYVGNVQVAMTRANLERKAIEDNKAVITCGTLLETSVYSATQHYETLKLDDEDSQPDTMRRIEGSTKYLACMYMDTFKYDHVFYLPPVQSVMDESDIERLREMDKNLQVAFNAFNLVPITPLSGGEGNLLKVTEQRCVEVFKHIFGEDEYEGLAQGAGTQSQVAD